MNTPEAIKELTRYINEPYSKLHPYFSEATKLGIEALKRVDKYRPLYAGKYPHLLPGETKD